jgi:drug/metabolite transporter (DMT)-like permease
MKNQKTTGYLSIIFVMMVWGSSFALTKLVVTTIPPVLFALIRHLIASLILLPFFIKARTGKEKPKIRKFDYLIFVLMGLTGIVLYYIAFNYALKYTTATVAAIIQGFAPVLIAASGFLFLKEQLNKWQFLGLLLAFTGVVLVGFLSPNNSGSNNKLIGNLLMVASVILWTIYTILSRKLKHLDPIMITSISTFAGTLLLIIPGLIEYFYVDTPLKISFNSWLSTIYLGAIGSAICYLLYIKALKVLPVVQVGNFLNLDPVVGVVIGMLFLHEQMTFWQVAGGVLVLTGIVLSSWKNHT